MESLERWREEMGIEEMVLCGHSLGGMVSSAYAMAYPNRSVDAVVCLWCCVCRNQ